MHNPLPSSNPPSISTSQTEDLAPQDGAQNAKHPVQSQQPSPAEVLEALNHVFHQTHVSLDGAAPSLNAVLQGPYFDDETLAHLTGGGPNDAYALSLALRAFNLSLAPWRPPRHIPVHEEVAFLCVQDSRWFALRRVGKHWMNLNDGIGRPAQILHWQLEMSLRQLKEDGCQVFVVAGPLPACEADSVELFQREFVWGVFGGVVCDDEEEYGYDEEEEEDGEDEEEEEEERLQTAIQRSLEEIRGEKISSPPMSIISTETGMGDMRLEKGHGQ